MKKSDLDFKVARALGVSRREVSRVTTAFLDEAQKALVRGHELYFTQLGRMRVGVAQYPNGNNHYAGIRRVDKLIVRKSGKFRKAVKDHMEKYAVEEPIDHDAMEKAAAAGCPICGRTPVRHGNTLMCPVHGTEPFESYEKK